MKSACWVKREGGRDVVSSLVLSFVLWMKVIVFLFRAFLSETKIKDRGRRQTRPPLSTGKVIRG